MQGNRDNPHTQRRKQNKIQLQVLNDDTALAMNYTKKKKLEWHKMLRKDNHDQPCPELPIILIITII